MDFPQIVRFFSKKSGKNLNNFPKKIFKKPNYLIFFIKKPNLNQYIKYDYPKIICFYKIIRFL
jgi:hypothetical protein